MGVNAMEPSVARLHRDRIRAGALACAARCRAQPVWARPRAKRVDLLTIDTHVFAVISNFRALFHLGHIGVARRAVEAEVDALRSEGFDTNGRPDDLLKRITYNANNYGKGAFLFADADAGPEDESRARRNRFPKRENLELEQKLYETMERQADEVVKARLAEAEKAAKEFNWDVYVDPDANAPVEADARPGISQPNGDGCGAAITRGAAPRGAGRTRERARGRVWREVFGQGGARRPRSRRWGPGEGSQAAGEPRVGAGTRRTREETKQRRGQGEEVEEVEEEEEEAKQVRQQQRQRQRLVVSLFIVVLVVLVKQAAQEEVEKVKAPLDDDAFGVKLTFSPHIYS